jgi:nicotinamide-nucleotide amidase
VIVEILILGDELLDGRRLDTNSAWLGRRLASLGAPPRFGQKISDRKDEIADAFRLALARSDLVISTGGLGPTADDVTFEALAEALELPLVFHPEIFSGIEARFQARGLRCPESNRRQAVLPEGARPLLDGGGTAPGLRIERGGRLVFALPGVPSEMESLFETAVRPEVEARLGAGRRTERSYKFIGLPESHVEEAIDRCRLGGIAGGEVRIAYTASFPQIDVTLSILEREAGRIDGILAEADAAIRRELGDHLAAWGDDTVESRLVRLLKSGNRTLAVAESATGGMVGARIVNVPGASEVFLGGVVAYGNEAKVSQLAVSRETLARDGAVSEACALEMARGARAAFGSDLAVSVTGIAGPGGGTPEKPVGLTFIAWVGPGFEEVRRYQFRWDRIRNKMLASEEALLGLIRHAS